MSITLKFNYIDFLFLNSKNVQISCFSFYKNYTNIKGKNMKKFKTLQQAHVNLASYSRNPTFTSIYNQSIYQTNYNYSNNYNNLSVNLNNSFNDCNNELNMFNLLKNGFNLELNSASYEEISSEIWKLVDDLTEGVEPFLD